MIVAKKDYLLATNLDTIPFSFENLYKYVCNDSTLDTLSRVLDLLNNKVDSFYKLTEQRLTNAEKIVFENEFGEKINSNDLAFSFTKDNMRFILVDYKYHTDKHFHVLDFTIPSKIDEDKINRMTTFFISSSVKDSDINIYDLIANVIKTKINRYFLSIGGMISRSEDDGAGNISIQDTPNVNDASFIFYYYNVLFETMDKVLDLKYNDFEHIECVRKFHSPIIRREYINKIYNYAICTDSKESPNDIIAEIYKHIMIKY